jgi:UDP-N-acetylmuramate--alanine ligase
VYAASEDPIVGVSGESLLREIAHPSKEFVPQIETLLETLPRNLSAGDLILFLGAGPIGSLPERFLPILQAEGQGVAESERVGDGREPTAELRVISGGR